MSERFERFADVLARFGLRDVIRALGHAPAHDHKWKSFPECPFCKHKDCAGVYQPKSGLEKFKCHHRDCSLNGVLDAVSYLALARGLATKPAPGQKLSEAAIEYLKLAGAWKEPVRRAQTAPQTAAESGEAPDETAEIPVENGDIPEEIGGIWAEGDGNSAETGLELPQEAESPAGLPEETPQASAPVESAGDAPPPGRVQASAPAEAGLEAGPAESDEEPALPVLLALREFHAAMPWLPEHEEECRRKRGLTPETCRLAGLRSSVPANREVLEGMRERYPMATLVAAGLFVREPRGEGYKPNPKLCGYGVLRKKLKSERRSEEDKWERGWCKPIVFAYYNSRGVLVGLSPHKDRLEGDITRLYEPAMAFAANGGKKEEAEAGAEAGAAAGAAARLDLPTLGMVTEGEFKALAWAQVLPDRPVIALTGIQQARLLWPDIEEWMALRLAPRATVSVVFDNEEKGDPNLPGFKPEEYDRHDAEVYARFLAWMIAREGYDGRVGKLPNDWRDANGKADWDGALAKLLGSATKIDKAFLKVALEAVPERDLQAGLFDTEAERVIRNKLSKLTYDPKLKSGREHEQGLVKRLKRFCMMMREDTEAVPAKFRGLLVNLAEQYRQTKGRYYILKPLSDKKAALVEKEMERAHHHNHGEYERLLRLLKDGVPKVVSNFTIKWHYMVRRVTGEHDRLVTLYNVWGESSGMVSLSAHSFSAPKDWQNWINARGGFAWHAGTTELQALNEDGARMLLGKTVSEVPSFGYDPDSRLWFFADCAIGPDGEMLVPKEDGIIWMRHRPGAESEDRKRGSWAQGYTLRRNAKRDPVCAENQEFVMGLPKMHPKVADLPNLEDFWQELVVKMHETVGGLDGNMVLGMMASYAVMPELFAAEGATPGLWLHGEQGSGKSFLARQIIRFWGYMRDTGRPLPNSSAAKIRVALQQSSDLPLWLEEYQPDCPVWLLELLKGVYDRSPGMKMDYDSKPRDITTSAVVTGVATSSNAQVKARYCHVHVSARRRRADHKQWFMDNSPKFYQFGRLFLRRRKEFVAAFQRRFQEWQQSPGMHDADARARMVYGVAYAGFCAVQDLLGIWNGSTDPGAPGAAARESYRQYAELYCVGAQQETAESVNVNQFWMDVVAAAQQGAFGQTRSEISRFFVWQERFMNHPPLDRLLQVMGATVEGQSRVEWASARLYFVPQLVIEALRMHKRKMGQEPPLDKNDLMAQMKVKPYWVAGTAGSFRGHRQRFAGKLQACWCIDVDYHELGLQPVSDEELSRGLFVDGDESKGWRSEGQRDDVRRGDLFVLGELLKRKEEEE